MYQAIRIREDNKVVTDDHGKEINFHTKQDALSVLSRMVLSSTTLNEQQLLTDHGIKINQIN